MNFSPSRIAALHLPAAALILAVAPALFATPEVASTSDPSPPPDPSLPAIHDEIVVTANRLASPADAVGSAVTVITAEEIARRGHPTVAEILRTVPGVEVVRGGGSGQVTSLFLRGGNSSHALVLVDGVRVNSATTGAFDFADLQTDAIERIEIVRGPQSTLYGSEAVTGVIAITTRHGRPGRHFTALAEAGGNHDRRFRAAAEGGDERFDYRLTVSDQTTDGISAASERAGNTEKDPYENTTAAARLGMALSGDGRADLTVRYSRGNASIDGYDFLAGPVDHLDATQEREGLAANFRVRTAFTSRWTQTFTAGIYDEDLVANDPEDFFGTYAFKSRSSELSAQSDLRLSPTDVLTVGLSAERREGGSVGAFDETVRLRSVFVQNAWSWQDRWHLTAGVRHDDHSAFGGETTYRLSGVWRPSATTRLHASYGTAFKAPTLNDLFFPFFNNPELAPETSEGLDVGVGQRFLGDRLSFDLTWFDQEFDDLIAYDFTTGRPENVARARSHGWELIAAYQPGPRFKVSGAYTFNETEDLASGQPLARRPRHRGTVSLFFSLRERLRGNLTLIAVRDRWDGDGRPMEDYERVDVNFQYRLSARFQPYVRVVNLFDEDYEEINGFTSPGLHAVGGLEVRF